jgi:sulfide:quinone oxidoreductase
MTRSIKPDRHHVVVAGGGVAAVEAMLALHHLAGRQVKTTLLATATDFAPRAAAVAAPFGLGAPAGIPLRAIAERTGAEIRRGALTGVKHEGRIALVDDRGALAYDTLLVAVGARARAAVPGALTFTGADSVSGVERMLDAAQRGELRRLAFAVPEGVSWTLPAYELAIMAAVELRARGATDTQVTLVTPEPAPLAIFGATAGTAITRMLRERGIELATGRPQAVRDGQLLWHDAEPLAADAVVALPAFEGPALEGLPADEHGFLPVDGHGRVAGVSHIYAAGDVTAFPVKQGGLAAQQADAAAEGIAAELGVLERPTPFEPVLRGLLLTGGAPLYLRAELAAGEVSSSPLGAQGREHAGDVSQRALWWPPGKVAGRYLAPFMATARPPSPASEPMVDRVARPARRAATGDREQALALALAVADQDAQIGDYRQAVHARDAAAALGGGVLPREYAKRRDAWARIGASRRNG